MHLSKKLYQSGLNQKKLLHHEDAIRMVSNSGLKLTEKESTLAFAYSKFPITDEMSDITNALLLNFGEFQEFIARLGQIKYPETQ